MVVCVVRPAVAVVGALCGVLIWPGCGSLDPGGGDHTGTDGGQYSPTDGGWVLNPEGGIDQDPNNPICNEERFEPERVGDPDIMIVMDMSTSMTDGTPTKYEQTAAAVSHVVTSLEAAGAPIMWGLIFFPSDGDCGVKNWPDVEISVGNASVVASTVTSTSPVGNTPTHKAVDLAATYYSGLNDGRAHYILLATDGQPNCETPAPLFPRQCATDANCNPGEYCQVLPGFGGICVPVPQDLAIHAIENAMAASVRTYVVGIDIDNTSSATLDRMAEAGGTARADSPKYYPVSDQTSLETALENITTQMISCTFQLSQPPPDMGYVSVTVAGHGISRDQTRTNGWDLDPASLTLTFYGDACTQLQQNPETVSVTYGCPPVG